jgi:hypothetical protein
MLSRSQQLQALREVVADLNKSNFQDEDRTGWLLPEITRNIKELGECKYSVPREISDFNRSSTGIADDCLEEVTEYLASLPKKTYGVPQDGTDRPTVKQINYLKKLIQSDPCNSHISDEQLAAATRQEVSTWINLALEGSL